MTDIDEREITNAERASRCQAALETYNDEWDLLADARHWCDRDSRCHAELDGAAHRHYLSELEHEWRGEP